MYSLGLSPGWKWECFDWAHSLWIRIVPQQSAWCFCLGVNWLVLVCLVPVFNFTSHVKFSVTSQDASHSLAMLLLLIQFGDSITMVNRRREIRFHAFLLPPALLFLTVVEGQCEDLSSRPDNCYSPWDLFLGIIHGSFSFLYVRVLNLALEFVHELMARKWTARSWLF